MQSQQKEEYLCFYTSELNIITTNPSCMSITLDDKSITRGYSLTDDFHISHNRILQFSQKLTRLLKEGQLINLKPRLSTVDEITAVIREMLETSRQLYGPSVFANDDHKLRLLLTGGGGDFSVALNKHNTQLYIAIILTIPPQSYDLEESLLTSSELQKLNFNIKSNNYLVRSYIATESKAQGGYLAIEADREEYLLEGSVATVAVLLENGDFVVPPFDRILPGTTAIKILDFLDKEVIPQYSDGYVKRIVRRDIKVAEAKQNAVEAMFLGGEECVPITEWDGEKVGDGKKGRLATMFQEHLKMFSKDEGMTKGQIKVEYASGKL
ncbi:hypothetical protein FGO68_gene9884 [Halteria grandinella]|uniref:Aminotransferase class IV n=1 Tax=Halteria grandinella TaxID=5974 RepID=A0A8J8NN68_HALGN|nr:hypothetical protein FGO68_gene9884 [Halteria grandinella]